MRQQYHSRLVDGKRYIWNVNKLIEIARDFPVKEISLNDIKELHENYWYDHETPTCKSIADHALLIEQTDLKYPILLCSQGYVIDGMHRVCKAYLKGNKTIKAVQFARDPEPDYIDEDLKNLPYEE